MRLITPKYFWIIFGIIAVIELILFLWKSTDTSCVNGAFLCFSLPAIFLAVLFVASPFLLIIITIVSFQREIGRQKSNAETKSVIKKGLKISVNLFAIGLIVRAIWYINYHMVIFWFNLIYPTMIIWLMVSLVAGVVYIQIKSNKTAPIV